jgi:hypothetical protein
MCIPRPLEVAVGIVACFLEAVDGIAPVELGDLKRKIGAKACDKRG